MAEETLDIVVNSEPARRGVDRLADGLRRLFNEARSTESATDRLFTRLNDGFRGLETQFFNLRNVILSFASVIGIFKELSDAMAKFQAFISTMTVTTGSIQNSRKEFEFLAGMANKLGVYVNDLTRNYAQLSAAVVGSNISHQTLQRTFESFGIAARTLHLSGHDTNLMFYAITQMVSKGAVSMEELRRQLGEKLPGAMGIAARSVNTTVTQLEEAIRKGTVDATKFVPIFAEAVRQTFGGGLENAAQALDANFNRLKNTLQAMIVTFYDLKVADAFSKILRELIRLMSDKQVAEIFAEVLKKIADQLTSFLKGITAEDIKRWVEGFTKGLGELSGFITNSVLPTIKTLADNLRLIVETILILKATSIGFMVGGPIGAAAGAGTGLGVVLAGRGVLPGTRDIFAPKPMSTKDADTVWNKARAGTGSAEFKAPDELLKEVQDRNKTVRWQKTLETMGFTMGETLRQKILTANEQEMHKLVTGLDWTNKKAVNEAATNMARLLYGGSNATLESVLMKGKDKKPGADPFKSFLEQLKQRLEGTGEEGNPYDAMREKLRQLKADKKGSISLSPQILDAISQLEARGTEFNPLIDQLESRLDRGNKETIETFEREFAKLLVKYPNASQTKRDQATELLDRFRAQEEGKKLVREANYMNQRTLGRIALATDMYESYQDFDEEIRKVQQQIKNMGLLTDAGERENKRLELEKKLREDVTKLQTKAIAIGDDSFDAAAFKRNQEIAIDAAIATLQQFQERQKSAQFGVQSSIKTYMEGLQNLAAGTSEIITSLFKGMEDAIVHFTLTGEVNIKKLAQTFVEQLARMYVQQMVMKPLIGTTEQPGWLTQGINILAGAAINAVGSGMGAGTMSGVRAPALGDSFSTTTNTGATNIDLGRSATGLKLDTLPISWRPQYAKGGEIKKDGGFIGERGREWFEPGISGLVVPNQVIEKMIRALAAERGPATEPSITNILPKPDIGDSRAISPAARLEVRTSNFNNTREILKTVDSAKQVRAVAAINNLEKYRLAGATRDRTESSKSAPLNSAARETQKLIERITNNSSLIERVTGTVIQRANTPAREIQQRIAQSPELRVEPRFDHYARLAIERPQQLAFAEGGDFPGAGWVGERGREWYQPNVPGTITPNRLAEPRGPASVTVNVNVNVETGAVTSDVATASDNQEIYARVGAMVGEVVNQKIVEMMRPGGILSGRTDRG